MLIILNAWRTFDLFFDHPVPFLASSVSLIGLVFMVIALILVSSNLVGYWIWIKKSEKSIEDGGSCLSPSVVRNINNFALIFIIAYIVIFVINAMGEGESNSAGFMVAYMAGFVIIVATLQKLRGIMRERGVSRGANITVMIIVDVVMVMFMMTILSHTTFSCEAQHGIQSETDMEYTSKKSTFWLQVRLEVWMTLAWTMK